MKKLTLTATGDSLFLADFPKEYEADFQKVREYLAAGDVRITNLETNLGKFGDFASAYSGGTWFNTEEKFFPYLKKFGFNYYGTANNHSMDYSYHGLNSTMKILKKNRLAFSGTGKDLDEAGKAAAVSANGGRIGVIAVTTTFEEASKAGTASLGSKARPGVNYVHAKQYFPVSGEDLEKLKEVAKASGVNDERNLDVAEGYALPDKEGLFTFGKTVFCTEDYGKLSECGKTDLDRVTESVRRAKEEYDLVVVLLHSHEMQGVTTATVPDFLVELAHGCLDAGAAAIIGGGVHSLRPVEIYRGKPIFYSLGNFIYQGMRVKYLPADFMEKYGIPAKSTAWEGLMKRSRNNQIGLQTIPLCYRTVIPKAVFEDGKAVSLELLPVELGFERPGDLNGLPTVADEKTGQEIADRLTKISQPFGTRFSLENGVIRVPLERED